MDWSLIAGLAGSTGEGRRCMPSVESISVEGESGVSNSIEGLGGGVFIYMGCLLKGWLVCSLHGDIHT
jgi:hypothetical protein